MADRSLTFNFLGRDKSAGKTADDLGKKFDKLGHSAQTTSGPLSKMGVIADHLGIQSFGKLQDHAQHTGHSLEQLGFSGKSSGGLLGAAVGGGALVAAAGIAELAKSGVEHFLDLTTQVRSFQRVSGATAEDSSKMVFALGKMGISAEDASKGMFRLARVDPSKLHAFGIEVAHNADGTTNLTETLLRVGDAYRKTADPAKRAQILFAAFGKSGQTLAPLLVKDREALNEFFKEADKTHQVFSQDDLNKARDYKMAMKDLHETVTGLEIEIGKGFVPVLTDAAHNMTSLASAADSVLGPLGGLGGLIGDVTSALNPIEWGKQIGRGFGLIHDGSKKAADGQDGLGQSADDAATKEAALTSALNAQKAALDAVAQAQQAQLGTLLSVDNSIENVKDATAAYNHTVALNTDRNKKNNVSQHDARQQYLALVGSVDSAAQAQVQYAENQAALAGKTLTAAQKTAIYRKSLQDLAARFPGLRAEIQQYLDKVGAIPARKTTTVSASTTAAQNSLQAVEAHLQALDGQRAHVYVDTYFRSYGKNAQSVATVAASHGRAVGGPVSPADGPYVVGERGPEIFMPTGAGTIIPHGQAGRHTAVGGGVEIHNHFDMRGALVMDRAAEKLAEVVTRAQQRNARRGFAPA